MVAINNVPFGPFRSGAWGLQLQAVHAEVVEQLSEADPEFQEVVRLQSDIDPLRFGGLADFSAWWKFFGELPMCTSAPEVLKYARWHSIQSCWKKMRPQFFLLKLVLDRMKDSSTAQVARSAPYR